jgi:dihydrofolate reductase
VIAGTKGRIMGKAVMGAVVSLDGFMADDNDAVGPLFDWLGNGDVSWSFPGAELGVNTTQASADFTLSQYADIAAVVIGRRVFDMTNGWDGKPAAGEHVFVVTHQPPAARSALKLGLIDEVVVNQVPVVFGSGRPFFATGGLAEPLMLENPTRIVQGDRVTHMVFAVRR